MEAIAPIGTGLAMSQIMLMEVKIALKTIGEGVAGGTMLDVVWKDVVTSAVLEMVG